MPGIILIILRFSFPLYSRLEVTRGSPCWNFERLLTHGSYLLFIDSLLRNLDHQICFKQDERWRLSERVGPFPARPAYTVFPSSWELDPSECDILVCSYSLHFWGPSTTILFIFENLLLVQSWAWCKSDPKGHLIKSQCPFPWSLSHSWRN